MPTPRPSPSSSPEHTPQGDVCPEEFQVLLRQVAAGNEDACRRLYLQFNEQILGFVRRHLNPRVRTRLESGDLLQEAWADIFTRLRDGQDVAFLGEFLRFAATVAKNKTLDAHRTHVKTQKRSLSREQPLGPEDGELRDRSEAGRDPSERSAAEDELARVLAGLSDRERAAVLGLLAGERLEPLARVLNGSV